uniref:Uncharacterized protein n=1 Tax=Siphoviridae sp. ct2vX3 TaxID=2825318 RepID=A0A8S5PYM7_9CAUD|nr:MAG TPA: hypothetical protein [Siphoviridae sp. ct2vX3]
MRTRSNPSSSSQGHMSLRGGRPGAIFGENDEKNFSNKT